MKTAFSVLLLAAACLLAPEVGAQRTGAIAPSGYLSRGYGYAPRGYVTSRVWIPGRYETVRERVWVQGCAERVWVEPVYGFRAVFGHCGTVRVVLRQGHWRTVQHPGHYEFRDVQVYQPGHWAPRGSCD